MAEKLTKMHCDECGRLTDHTLAPSAQADGRLRLTTSCVQCGAKGRGRFIK